MALPAVRSGDCGSSQAHYCLGCVLQRLSLRQGTATELTGRRVGVGGALGEKWRSEGWVCFKGEMTVSLEGTFVAATWEQPGTPEKAVVSCTNFVTRCTMFELASILEYIYSSPKQQSVLGMKC